MNILNPRVITLMFETAGMVPTVPASNDHKDGSWLVTDIYEGEMVLNTVDQKYYTRVIDEIIELTGGGGDGLIGSVKIVDAIETKTIDTNRQNLIYGTMTVNGIVNNEGEIVALNGGVTVEGAGEIINTGTIKVVDLVIA